MMYYNYSSHYYPMNKKNMNSSNFFKPYTNILTSPPLTMDNHLYNATRKHKKYQNVEKSKKNLQFSTENQSHALSFPQIPQKKPPSSNEDEAFFEIFGLKLYFDDILLICLIFFLYNEGVKDQYLFIALILLLLS